MEKYPYDEWADGRSHILQRGYDFSWDLTIASFMTAVRRGMKVRGYKVQAEKLDYSRVKIKVTPL